MGKGSILFPSILKNPKLWKEKYQKKWKEKNKGSLGFFLGGKIWHFTAGENISFRYILFPNLLLLKKPCKILWECYNFTVMCTCVFCGDHKPFDGDQHYGFFLLRDWIALSPTKVSGWSYTLQSNQPLCHKLNYPKTWHTKHYFLIQLWRQSLQIFGFYSLIPVSHFLQITPLLSKTQ
jgi:hypothetical protein